MNKMLIKGLLVLSIVFLFGAFSCGQAISQADYDSLKSKLSQTESQLKALQAKPATTTPSDNLSVELSKNIEELRKQIELYAGQIAALEAQKKTAEASLKDLSLKFTEFQKQYEGLKKQYEELTKPPEEITEEKVEQAIFALINQERTKNNVPELLWGKNLYNITKQHGRYMAEIGRFEYSTWTFFHEIYWAAGYNSVDSIAGGALLVWKNNQYRYEHGILSKAFKYGAVGAYKSGEVYFITFMAADVP